MRGRQQGQAVTGLTWPFPGSGSGVYKKAAEVLSWISIVELSLQLLVPGCIIANLIIIRLEHAGSLGRLIWPHLSGVQL